MKKKYILLTAFIGVMLSACSDFLDRKPLTEPNNEEYLCSRAQVENYINVYGASCSFSIWYGSER